MRRTPIRGRKNESRGQSKILSKRKRMREKGRKTESSGDRVGEELLL
jgi:hypothetical protein